MDYLLGSGSTRQTKFLSSQSLCLVTGHIILNTGKCYECGPRKSKKYKGGGDGHTFNLIGSGEGLKVFELKNEIGIVLWED